MGRTRTKVQKRTDAELLLAAVDAAPADPLPRLVFADWLEERGRVADARALRLGWGAVRKIDGGYGDGGDGGGGGGYGGDGGGGGFGDGGDGGGGGGYGDGGDGGGGGFGGDGADDGDGVGDMKTHLSRGFSMRDGLHLVCSPGGWAPYVIVAWCRVRDGWIEYAPGHRCVRRFGGHGQLSKLAAKGPIETTQLLEPSKTGGGCSTAAVSRYEVCDPAAWAASVPRPDGWEDES